jgi:excisionase family DNA binding protein
VVAPGSLEAVVQAAVQAALVEHAEQLRKIIREEIARAVPVQTGAPINLDDLLTTVDGAREATLQRLQAGQPEMEDLIALVADLRSIAASFSQPKAELLSKSEAARLLGVHRTETLPKLIRDGVLRTIPFGKRERISRDDIERVKRQGLLAVYAPKAKKKGRPPKQAPESTITLDSWRPTAR